MLIISKGAVAIPIITVPAPTTNPAPTFKTSIAPKVIPVCWSNSEPVGVLIYLNFR